MNELKKCICIGDSIVNGYPFEREYSWVWLLEGKISESFVRSGIKTGIQMTNCGVNGETSIEIKERFSSDGLDLNSACVLISAGANDIIFTDADPEKVMDNLKVMWRMASDRKVPAFLLSPLLTVPEMAERQWFDGTNYEKVNEKLVLLREMIRKSGLPFLDVQTAFKAYCENGGCEPEDCYVDGIHPTKHGYEKIAEFLAADEKLREMLQRM